MHRRGEIWEPPVEASQASPEARDEATRYQRDPLGGNKRDHLIAKKGRENWAPRKIAKFFGISVSEVKTVLERAGL